MCCLRPAIPYLVLGGQQLLRVPERPGQPLHRRAVRVLGAVLILLLYLVQRRHLPRPDPSAHSTPSSGLQRLRPIRPHLVLAEQAVLRDPERPEQPVLGCAVCLHRPLHQLQVRLMQRRHMYPRGADSCSSDTRASNSGCSHTGTAYSGSTNTGAADASPSYTGADSCSADARAPDARSAHAQTDAAAAPLPGRRFLDGEHLQWDHRLPAAGVRQVYLPRVAGHVQGRPVRAQGGLEGGPDDACGGNHRVSASAKRSAAGGKQSR
jgi:hypothetical protein